MIPPLPPVFRYSEDSTHTIPRTGAEADAGDCCLLWPKAVLLHQHFLAVEDVESLSGLADTLALQVEQLAGSCG